MKLHDSTQFNKVTEVLKVATSRQKLRQVLATPLYANAFYLMLSNAVMSLSGFFFWLIVARFYDEKVVGNSSAIISALNFLAVLSLAGLNISLIRFLPQADKPRELINTCFTLCGVISLVAGGIFLAGLDLWSPALAFIRQNIIFCLAFLVFAPVWTLSLIAQAAFLASRNTVFTLFQQTIFSLLKLPLPVLLVAFFYTFGVVASWGIALAIALAVAVFLFLPRVQDGYQPLPALNLNVVKDMWQYSTGNYLSNLFSAAPGYLLPMMVVNLLNAQQNAYFYVAWMMAGLLFAIPSAVSQSLFSEGSHFEHSLKENVVKSFKFSFLLLVPAVILLMLAGKWLLLAFGESYSLSALNLLWVLCLSALPYGVVSIYTSILRVTGRIKELVLIYGFIALSVLGASYFIIPDFGIIAIGYTWLGTNFLIAIYCIVRIRNCFTINPLFTGKSAGRSG